MVADHDFRSWKLEFITSKVFSEVKGIGKLQIQVVDNVLVMKKQLFHYRDFPTQVLSSLQWKLDWISLFFPISFILCINSNEGMEKVKEFGYLDEWYLFYGWSKFSDSTIGWTGHSRDGPLYNSAEGRKKSLFIFLTLSGAAQCKIASPWKIDNVTIHFTTF